MHLDKRIVLDRLWDRVLGYGVWRINLRFYDSKNFFENEIYPYFLSFGSLSYWAVITWDCEWRSIDVITWCCETQCLVLLTSPFTSTLGLINSVSRSVSRRPFFIFLTPPTIQSKTNHRSNTPQQNTKHQNMCLRIFELFSCGHTSEKPLYRIRCTSQITERYFDVHVQFLCPGKNGEKGVKFLGGYKCEACCERMIFGNSEENMEGLGDGVAWGSMGKG